MLSIFRSLLVSQLVGFRDTNNSTNNFLGFSGTAWDTMKQKALADCGLQGLSWTP